MNSITLSPDGFIISHTGKPKEMDPIEKLGDQVILAENFSFGSFFKMLSAYPDLIRLNVFFPGLMERFRDIRGNNLTTQSAEPVEFGKTVEMIGFPGTPRIEIYNSLRKTNRDGSGEIQSSAFPDLLGIPIRLGKLHHIVFGDKVNVFEFDTTYTFFEFIDGIAWELGFLTTPGECQLRR